MRQLKITGWAYNGYVDGQEAIVIVHGPTYAKAVEQFRQAVLVTDPTQIVPVTILPGHGHYPWWEEHGWMREQECGSEEER
jgi:hypothetical protein